MKKTLKIFLLIIGIILISTACKKEPPYEDLSLDYLNDRYASEHDTFTYINCGYDVFKGWGDKCYFKSEKYDGDITVYISKNDDEYVFKDNYFRLFMKDDAQAYLENIIKPYSNMAVKFRFSSIKEEYKTFDDYLKSGYCRLDVYFISNKSFNKNTIDIILKKIVSDKISGVIKFYETSDNNLLKDYDLDYVLNNQRELIKAKQEYGIDYSNYEIKEK